MNPISEQIHTAVDKALTNGLVRPTALYLGYDEHRALVDYAEAYLKSVEKKVTIGDDGLEFDGMRVYRVMEKSHLGVS